MSTEPRKAIIIDDDPVFGLMLLRTAELLNIDAVYVRRAKDMEAIDPNCFDFAMIDFNIDGQSGVLLAASMGSVPVVLMSGVPRWAALEIPSCTKNVRGFLRKRRDLKGLWRDALVALKRVP